MGDRIGGINAVPRREQTSIIYATCLLDPSYRESFSKRIGALPPLAQPLAQRLAQPLACLVLSSEPLLTLAGPRLTASSLEQPRTPNLAI